MLRCADEGPLPAPPAADFRARRCAPAAGSSCRPRAAALRGAQPRSAACHPPRRRWLSCQAAPCPRYAAGGSDTAASAGAGPAAAGRCGACAAAVAGRGDRAGARAWPGLSAGGARAGVSPRRARARCRVGAGWRRPPSVMDGASRAAATCR